jgi:hypothetical protein
VTFTNISQGHLKVLTTCARKFGYLYIDRLSQPIDPEQELKMRWGSQFHLLMQQREMGLPIEPFLEKSPLLGNWLRSMVSTAPDIFEIKPNQRRESERVRTVLMDEYLLMTISDLVILEPDRARIIDWKTYPLPKQKQDLDRDWQLRLYMYVLAETSSFSPKQISFTYWFIQSLPQPQSLAFKYTIKQHKETQRELQEILASLTSLWETHGSNGSDWPQVDLGSGHCKFCNFANRCDRATKTPATQPEIDLAAIPEVEI